jgi:hypothetical protein
MREVVQVDVVLFTCVEDMLAFLRHHPELGKYGTLKLACYVLE